MNCTVLQRRLLALENPRRPPAELLAHLARCAACRDWQRRLLELELRVPHLPVPPSSAKEQFIARLVTGEVGPRREHRPARMPVAGRIGPGARERHLAKVALVTALAAGLLMFFSVIVILRNPRPSSPGTPPAPDPLLATLLTRDLKLAAPKTTRPDRFRTLADLADDLEGQAQPLAEANAVDDLKALAEWYRQVVHDGVEALGQARGVSAQDRDEVATRLDRASASATELAAKVSPECQPPLLQIAIAAQGASKTLQPGARSLRPRPGKGRSPMLGLACGLPPGRAPLPACAPAVVLAAVARAESPDARLSPAEQAQRFRRNRGLIDKLVTGGVRLAGEDDPVKRADCCNGIAQSMADEIRRAAEDHEKARAVELGQHLRSLLKSGVAENLSRAREGIPSGSAEEKALQKVRDDTEQFLKPVQEVIDATDAGADVKDGLDSVIRAVQPKP
jgi:hypothetical protein